MYTADSLHVILTFAAVTQQCQLGRKAEQLVVQPVTAVNMTAVIILTYIHQTNLSDSHFQIFLVSLTLK